MRAEYSESNNSKMIEFALLPLTDFFDMECSRLSVRGKELAEEGLFRLGSGIDNNSVEVAFKW
jgi:hypothetical protein